jgi:hypothetical protein
VIVKTGLLPVGIRRKESLAGTEEGRKEESEGREFIP